MPITGTRLHPCPMCRGMGKVFIGLDIVDCLGCNGFGHTWDPRG